MSDELNNPHTTTYDTLGLYPLVETNALGQTTTTVIDYRWGKPISVTDDPNNATTTYSYDAGR